MGGFEAYGPGYGVQVMADNWRAVKARKLLQALLRMGWVIKRQSGSRRTLARAGWPDYTFAFHDDDEIGPQMLSRVAKRTGLRPEDL